jgi:DNA invertase Pin-like site-specific DNA recombinase
MIYPSDLKGFKPVVYLRISSDEQGPQDKGKPLEKRQAMVNQLAKVKRYLKDNGLPMPKPENIHYELASGGDPTRPVLKRAIQQAVDMKGKRMFVVAELSRFARRIRYGMKDTIPLFENDIPLVATDDQMITGTKNNPQAQQDIMMGIAIALATGEREKLRQRVRSSIETKTAQGIFVSKGLEIFPEADGDIYQYVIDNVEKFAPKDKGGLGWTASYRLLETIYGSKPPFSNQWSRKASKRILDLKGEMTPEEFENWNNFRKRILEMERMFGKDDFRLKAVRYRSNGYLTDPLNPNFSTQPDEEMIQNAIDNPADNLSFKDARKYRKDISKKRV